MKTKMMTREECEAELHKMVRDLDEAGMRIRLSATQSRHLGARNHRRFHYHLEVACGTVEAEACTEMAWHIKGNLQKIYEAVAAMHMVITYQAASKRESSAPAPPTNDARAARARAWSPREFMRAARRTKNATIFICRHRSLLESWRWADVTVPILHRFDAKELFPTPALQTMIHALEPVARKSAPRAAA